MDIEGVRKVCQRRRGQRIVFSFGEGNNQRFTFIWVDGSTPLPERRVVLKKGLYYLSATGRYENPRNLRGYVFEEVS